jgi:hypothetical protein
MRERLIVLVLLAIVAGCTGEPGTTEPAAVLDLQASSAPVEKATGSGIIAPAAYFRHFAFQANLNASGRVWGQAQLSWTRGALIHMAIDCLEVDGSQATMSGYVTRSNALDSGWPIWFRVVDGGEPPANDQLTFLYFWPDGGEVDCTEDVIVQGQSAPLVPIRAGNVQVH